MPSATVIAPPRCHPPPDGGTLRHVNNSLPGPVSEGSVHGNGSRQPDNWLLALAEPFVTVLAHGNGVTVPDAHGVTETDTVPEEAVPVEAVPVEVVPVEAVPESGANGANLAPVPAP